MFLDKNIPKDIPTYHPYIRLYQRRIRRFSLCLSTSALPSSSIFIIYPAAPPTLPSATGTASLCYNRIALPYIDYNRCLTCDRTLVLAEATSNTAVLYHIWPLHSSKLTCFKIRHFFVRENDCLWRYRAVFFADQTVNIMHPGDTPAPVDERGTDALHLLFF